VTVDFSGRAERRSRERRNACATSIVEEREVGAIFMRSSANVRSKSRRRGADKNVGFRTARRRSSLLMALQAIFAPSHG